MVINKKRLSSDIDFFIKKEIFTLRVRLRFRLPIVSERFLGLRMKEIGLEQKRLTDEQYWQGIGFPPCPL
jgi:hypothetical protein